MKGFIGPIQPICFIEQDCHGIPPEPAPPGPYDRLIPTNNGLNGYSTPYNSPTGAMLIGITGRNGAASAPGIVVSWNGVPMTKVAEVHDSTPGHAFSFLGIIKGGATGTHNLTITTTGTAGFAALRIIDIVTYDAIGDVKTFIGNAGLIDLTLASQAPGAGDIAEQVGWLDDRAYPIEQFYGGLVQWQTRQFQAGTDVVVNGDFTAGLAPWTQGGDWTVAGGVATSKAIGGRILQQPTSAVVAGNRYLISYEITDFSTGTMQFLWRTGGYLLVGAQFASEGIHLQGVVAPSGVVGFGIQGSQNAPAGVSIDNVKIAPITAGMAAWFGRQATPAAGTQITFEAANYNDNPHGVAIVAEIKGIVRP